MNQDEISTLIERNKFLEDYYNKSQGREKQFTERVKELNCLYNVAKYIFREDDLHTALRNIVCVVPEGWQFSELVAVSINLYGETIGSGTPSEASYTLQEPLYLNDEKVGDIEVSYSASPKISSSAPFLPEEEDLLCGISRMIGLFLQKDKQNKHNKLIQEQLLHSDRLATIGQLAAGVAHELNEPLSSILGFTQLIISDNKIDCDTKSDLRNIEEASLHAKEIIQQLMSFSRQSKLSPDHVNLKNLIADGLNLTRSRCQKQKITVLSELEDVFTIVDPVQIKQLITNLSVNAIQAMPRGGELSVTLKLIDQTAHIVIKDSGVGINEVDVGKIFMPFYTTKDVGEGTGLGLSVVYGIIKGHGGEITVSSELNVGTTFHIRLPVSSK